MRAGLGRYAVRAPKCASSWRPRYHVLGEGIPTLVGARNAGAPFLGVHILWARKERVRKQSS